MQTFEELGIDLTVSSLSAAMYDQGKMKANKALITVEDAAIRFLVDGSKPTATVGHLASAGDAIELGSHDEIKHFKCIKGTSGGTPYAGDAQLKISYFFSNNEF